MIPPIRREGKPLGLLWMLAACQFPSAGDCDRNAVAHGDPLGRLERLAYPITCPLRMSYPLERASLYVQNKRPGLPQTGAFASSPEGIGKCPPPDKPSVAALSELEVTSVLITPLT